MFEFSIMWIITIISSFANNMSIGLRMFKDVADAGYKIDIEHLSGILNEINPEGTKITWIEMLIPFYNLYKSIMARSQYVENRDAILQQLDTLGSVEEMSEWEKKEYSKNTTGLNAILVTIKSVNQLNNSVKISLSDNQGTIWFVNEEETKDILIVKAEGPIANLTIEEQKQRIRGTLNRLADDIVDEYGSFESLKKEIKESMSSGDKEIKITLHEKSTSAKIEDLKELKKELTREETAEEKGYQKTNKKDK